MPLPQFPVNNVANAKKAALVYAICRRTGYGRSEDGSGWDPVKWAWWDGTPGSEVGNTADPAYAAAEAHYNAVLTAITKANPLTAQNPLAVIYLAELRRDRAAAIAEPEL